MSIAATLSISLEAFLENPIDRTEWIDGQVFEKEKRDAKTGRIQARLARYWRNYQEFSHQGGEIYMGAACRTIGASSFENAERNCNHSKSIAGI